MLSCHQSPVLNSKQESCQKELVVRCLSVARVLLVRKNVHCVTDPRCSNSIYSCPKHIALYMQHRQLMLLDLTSMFSWCCSDVTFYRLALLLSFICSCKVCSESVVRECLIRVFESTSNLFASIFSQQGYWLGFSDGSTGKFDAMSRSWARWCRTLWEFSWMEVGLGDISLITTSMSWYRHESTFSSEAKKARPKVTNEPAACEREDIETQQKAWQQGVSPSFQVHFLLWASMAHVLGAAEASTSCLIEKQVLYFRLGIKLAAYRKSGHLKIFRQQPSFE